MALIGFYFFLTRDISSCASSVNRVKDVKKKVSAIYRNGKAKVTGKGDSYDITQPEAPTFANPLFEGGEGVPSDTSVEGAAVPAGLVLPAVQITETADEASIRLAKQKQQTFYRLRNVKKFQQLV